VDAIGDALTGLSKRSHGGSVERDALSRKALRYHRGMKLEYALVADHAEIVHGRLFLMGGGRDAFSAEKVPALLRMALAVGVRIEWEETNVGHDIVVTVDDEDGKQIVRIEAGVNVGRPAGLPPGSSQLAQFATALPLRVEKFGGLRVKISAGTGPAAVKHSIPFRVVEAQGRAPQQRAQT
jgi:Family of unknown function (DUF6941)